MALISISTLNGWHQSKSAIRAICRLWRADGHKVRVGRRFDVNADVAFLHHDLSVVEAEKAPKAGAGVPVINGNALDIRKRGYSELRVTEQDDWDGEVLIKTNLNSFGSPERMARRWKLSDFSERRRHKHAARDWRSARRIVGPTYPVLDHIRDVPDWVWESPDYLVERFMPERDGDHYCLRGWMFLGSRGYAWRLFSTDPMVKTGTMVRHEYLEKAPPELTRVRDMCGLDYGKIDYVEHDGRAIVLDANKTPFFVGAADSPRLRDLARGIEDYLP